MGIRSRIPAGRPTGRPFSPWQTDVDADDIDIHIGGTDIDVCDGCL